jgi:hypothetical protein
MDPSTHHEPVLELLELDGGQLLGVLGLEAQGVELQVPGLRVLLDRGAKHLQGGDGDADLDGGKGALRRHLV